MVNSFEKSFTPYLKFNEMIAKTTESAIKQHFKSVEKFTKISMDNFYAGINARTLDEVVSFSKQQPEFLKKSSELFVEESKEFAKLGSQVFDSTQEIFSINLKDVNFKMPTIDNMKYDLGESIVIRKPEKKAATKAKKSSVSAKTKKASKKTVAKKKVTKKAAKPATSIKKAKPAAKATAKAKSTKKPVSAKNTKAKSVSKATKVKSTKASVASSAKLTKTTSPKAVKPKAVQTKQASKENLVKPVKNESKNTVLKTTVNKPKITANKIAVPAWDKPKSVVEKNVNAQSKSPSVTSSISTLKPSVRSIKNTKK